MADLMFYLFSALTLASAACVVLTKNTVSGAMCFLLSLVGVAGLFVLLQAYLLAVLLVLVYAGAVVALFLFIVMLLDMQGGARLPFKKMTIGAATIAFALLVIGVLSLANHSELTATTTALPESLGSSLKLYGVQLFTTYLLPVQVVGFLLLIAMLGVIVLSKKFAGLEDIK